MDPNFLQSIVAGIAAGLTSLALLPMIFKGQLLHKRELEASEARAKQSAADARERLDEMVKLKDREIARLQDSLEATQTELREQYGVNAETSRQVFAAIGFLQSMAGIASQERRGGQRTTSGG